MLTVFFLCGSAELISRYAFSESTKSLASCFVMNDPTTGVRGKPNCVTLEKDPESPWTETRFNSSGYRADRDFAPKAPGTYRIVMMGSSVALGEKVQRPQSLATLLPQELSQSTGRKIELYNEAMGFGFSHNTTLRFEGALQSQPDMILWVITPIDVESADFVIPKLDIVGWNNRALATKAWDRIHNDLMSKSIVDTLSEAFGRTRTALMLRHYLYQSQSQYVKFSLMGDAEKTDCLKTNPSPLWAVRLKQVDADAADMEARARAAGVPFVAVYLPNRVQTAMISMGEWPQGFDPYKIGRELRTIITAHGGTYLDILPDFRTIPDPEKDFLPVDGHPNADGQALFSRLVAKALTSGPHPVIGPADVPMTDAEVKP